MIKSYKVEKEAGYYKVNQYDEQGMLFRCSSINSKLVQNSGSDYRTDVCRAIDYVINYGELTL